MCQYALMSDKEATCHWTEKTKNRYAVYNHFCAFCFFVLFERSDAQCIDIAGLFGCVCECFWYGNITLAFLFWACTRNGILYIAHWVNVQLFTEVFRMRFADASLPFECVGMAWANTHAWYFLRVEARVHGHSVQRKVHELKKTRVNTCRASYRDRKR